MTKTNFANMTPIELLDAMNKKNQERWTVEDNIRTFNKYIKNSAVNYVNEQVKKGKTLTVNKTEKSETIDELVDLCCKKNHFESTLTLTNLPNYLDKILK